MLNHDGGEISVTSLVEQSPVKLLILIISSKVKTIFEVQRKFNANTTLEALFKIRFR